jgi:serine/threonine protein kinase
MMKGSYEISDALSDSLKKLITDILKFDPAERISLKEILAHQWVEDIQEIVSNGP